MEGPNPGTNAIERWLTLADRCMIDSRDRKYVRNVGTVNRCRLQLVFYFTRGRFKSHRSGRTPISLRARSILVFFLHIFLKFMYYSSISAAGNTLLLSRL